MTRPIQESAEEILQVVEQDTGHVKSQIRSAPITHNAMGSLGLKENQ